MRDRQLAPIVRCVGLEVGRTRAILPPIDLELGRGQLWALVGRNGSGKTTFFLTLLGQLRPVAGQIHWASPRPRIGYLPQRTSYDDLFPMRARDVVSLALDTAWSFARPRWREPTEVLAALTEVGAADLADRPFRALSEGQKQRVLLAKLVAARAELAFLDEPTAAMDAVAERDTFERIAELTRRHGATVVVVSHHVELARRYADHVLLFDPETPAVLRGRPDEVLESHEYRRSYRPPAPGGPVPEAS
ncbi:MAG: metal ABC transporter ATP-binding protein [Deltaproteobacteria bacterium]|nr:metal ABC transporter ATP-binding protein [Deltaproteobacteria bacterium]